VSVIGGAVAQVLGPADGGIRSHVRALVPRLEHLGVPAPVFAPMELGDPVCDVEPVPVPGSGASMGWWSARRSLDAALDRCERGPVVLLHAHGLKAAFLCERLRSGQPLVVSVHNVVLPGPGGTRRRLAERAAASTWRRADRLVVPSAAVLEDLPSALHHNARVVAPVVEIAPPVRSAHEVRRSLGVPDGAPLAVCVARLHPQKRLDVLAAAWRTVQRRAPGAWLVVAGDGPERAAVEAWFAGMTGVVLAGAIAAVSDVLAAADVSVISSDWEAVPLVLIESLGVGTPVVCTDVGVARELLADGRSGRVVDTGDPEALAEAIGSMLAVSSSVGGEPRTGGAPIYPVGFEPDQLVRRLVDVYQELL